MPRLHRTTLSGRNMATGRRVPVLDTVSIGWDGEDLSWQRDAACGDADPELFFAKPGFGMAATIAAAKRVCLSCPVRTACRAYARAHREPYGIWGGEHRDPEPDEPAARPAQARDAEIARLTRAGLSAHQIAVRLHVTDRTVTRARARVRDADEAA